MKPKNLRTPSSDLVLVRFTTFDQDGLAEYRLWRIPPGLTAGAGPTIMEFLAPSDDEAEALVAAWYHRTPFPLSHSRYRWHEKLHARAEEKRQIWHTTMVSEKADKQEQWETLREYMAADQDNKLLLNALVGRWNGQE